MESWKLDILVEKKQEIMGICMKKILTVEQLYTHDLIDYDFMGLYNSFTENTQDKIRKKDTELESCWRE